MSSSSDAAAALAGLYNDLFTGECCTLAALVLFFYDATITLNREVACFRATKWSGALLLFMANKVLSATFYFMTVAKYTPYFSDTRLANVAADGDNCSSYQKVSFAIQLSQMIPWAVFSALRAYVLSRRKLLGILVLILSLAPVGVNLSHYGDGFSGVYMPPFGCLYTDESSTDLNRKLTIISRVPLIVADVLLIYITWSKLSNREALRGIRRSQRLSLSEVILRDGTVYFIINLSALFVLNVLHLTFSLLSMAKDGNQSSYVTTFTAPITAILMSRFLLQLQEANQAAVGLLESDRSQHLSTFIAYNRSLEFVRSLGGTIDPDLSDHDGEHSGRGRHSDEDLCP